MKREKIPFLTEEKKKEYQIKAQPYMNLSPEFLWECVPSQMVPRSYAVTKPQTTGCLVCGHKVMEHGNYPYLIDPINRPWKITCPSCGYTFPTNDFEAYYKGGLDANGFFDPALAKAHNDELIAAGEKGNLVNTLYPEKGENWGVDDSTGYVAEDGTKYAFIAYCHHFIWYTSQGQGAIIPPALEALQHAYEATNDPAYAEKGIILLDRIADVYPDMTLDIWTRADGYLNSNGGGCDKGKILGSIWETGLASRFLRAFSVFAKPLEEGLIPKAVEFLQSKNPAKNSSKAIWDNIMEGIVKQIYPAVKDTQIYGNSGMHQHTLALASVLWDQMPETKEWLDFNFRTAEENRDTLDGGNIMSILTDRIDRDGHGQEASPGYNSIWLHCYLDVADVLDGYELEGMETRDLYKNAKFRKMFSSMYPLILSDIYTAKIGDTAACGNPGYIANVPTLIKAFLKFGDIRFAQAAYLINGRKTEGMDLSGFSIAPESIASKIEEVIKAYGELELKGTNLTGYGFIALRDGNSGDMFTNPANSNQRDLWMYHGRNTGHGHRDTLNIGIHAYGLDVMPDMGYPRYADSMDMHRVSMVINTLSHNTVVVDSKPQVPHLIGQPLHYDYGDRVKLFDVSAKTAYEGTVDTYRRTSAMIKIDKDASYVVDFFRVAGSNKHCYSFHGAEQNGIVTTGLNLAKQADANGNYIGTYAGSDTAYPDNCDVKDETGARYLINVEKQEHAGDFSVDYSVLDTWDILGNGAGAPTDIHVKLSMLGDFDEVALADALPPENKVGNPKLLRYVLASRKGDNLKSCYAAVIEPYRKESKIASIEALTVTENGTAVCPMCARAVKATLTNGRIDYIVNAIDSSIKYTVTDGNTEFAFQGFFGVWSVENGQNSYYLNDGTQIGEKTNPALPHVTGTVVDFTKELSVKNEIIIKADQANVSLSDLTGQYINIENDGIHNASYRIESASLRADGNWALDIGDVSTVRQYADAYDFSKGFVYDIEVGKQFQIPLSFETK